MYQQTDTKFTFGKLRIITILIDQRVISPVKRNIGIYPQTCFESETCSVNYFTY